MLTGELVKDLVLVQTHPKEIIEYIRKLEAQVIDSHLKLSEEIDRLERLLELQSEKPFKKSTQSPIEWRWDTHTTSGTPWIYQSTTSGNTNE